jgi:TonB family protein
MLVVWVSVASLAFEEPALKSAAQPRIVCNPVLKLRRMVEPIYPEAAQENGIRGTVVVEVLIDKQGVPQAVHAVRGNPILANAVSTAVQQWRWQPYRLNREAVEVEMTIAIDFEPAVMQEHVCQTG